MWLTAPLKGRREPGEEMHSLHFSIPQETSSLRYLSRMTEEALSVCYNRRVITRTFDNFPSSSFLEKLSLCEHSFLTLPFANDDFYHGRGSQSEIVIRSYTICPVSVPSPFSSTRGCQTTQRQQRQSCQQATMQLLWLLLLSFITTVTPQALNSSTSLVWGAFRPNLYFGLRPRIPQSLMTGLVWFGTQDYQSFTSMLFLAMQMLLF